MPHKTIQGSETRKSQEYPDDFVDLVLGRVVEIKKEEMPFYGCVDDDVAEPAVINALATIDGMVHAVCFIDCIKDGEQWKPIFEAAEHLLANRSNINFRYWFARLDNIDFSIDIFITASGPWGCV